MTPFLPIAIDDETLVQRSSEEQGGQAKGPRDLGEAKRPVAHEVPWGVVVVQQA